MAEAKGSSSKRTGTAAEGSGEQARRSVLTRPAEAVGRNVSAVRDVVTRTMLAPVNAVLLTRRGIEEVVDDAVRRGRMTREDAQQMLQSLLQRGAQQTDDFLADLERLLGRGAIEQRTGPAPASRARRSRSRRPGANLPIDGYDDLSAAQVQDRLDGLTPADLRRLRDYERRHANRKTVLDPIERQLR